MSQQQTSARKTPSAAKYWCFTLNNPTMTPQEVWEACKEWTQYLVFQREKGASHQTEHYQGYIALSVKKRLTHLKKWLPTAHFENRRGSHSQARDYCTKDDTRAEGENSGPWYFGTEETIPEKSGQRTDLDEVKVKLDAGVPMETIWDEHFTASVRYHKSFTHYRALKTTGRTNPPRIYVLYGETGSGKTLLANKLAGPNAFYLSKPAPNQPLWFDGYQPGQNLIIDEYYGWIPFDTILRMLDRNPWQAKIHGGMVHFDSPVIVFCSNASPDRWYPKVSGYQPFARRLAEFGTIHYYPNPYIYRKGVCECPELNEPRSIRDFFPLLSDNFSFQLAEPAVAGEDPALVLYSSSSADRHADRGGKEAEADTPCDPNGSPIYSDEDSEMSQVLFVDE